MASKQKVTKLKPCPFCGEPPVSEWIHSDAPGMEDCGYWSTGCEDPKNVHKGLCVDAYADTEEESNSLWNRRHTRAKAR